MHVLTCSVSAETVRRILRHYVVHEVSAAGDPYTLLTEYVDRSNHRCSLSEESCYVVIPVLPV